jgi:hypothetical protein
MKNRMTGTWTISVNGHSYGPYTAAQMRAFVAEGRLAAQSLVARAGADTYTPAAQDEELAPLFRAPAATRPVFFTADGDVSQQNFGKRDDEEAHERSHYIIVADMKSRSITGLEEEIFALGQAQPILPQAWLLASETPINVVRNTLVKRLGKLDILFVVDATHDKAAWFNFGPETDTRIRRLWQKQQDPADQRKTG